MKNKITMGLLCLFLTVIFGINAVNYHPDLTEEEYIEMFQTTMKQIKENFVDTDKINLEKLYFGAIEGALKSLNDPYTRFLPPQKYDDLKTKTSSQFGGLGIVISLKNDVLTVVSPIYGTPAYKVGIMPGDQIVEIEGESTEGIKLNKAVEKMRGEPGTKIEITIARPSFLKPKKFTLERAIIKLETVQKKMLDDEIGYIRLTEFSDKSYDAVKDAISELTEKGMKKLVFDLRNNPGGLLTSAYKIANLFIEKGMIVYTRGRISYQDRDYLATPQNTYKDLPLIVLANGGSASGSEIVVGAIKDNKRGLIVGTKTFGKGLVQSVFPFRSLPESNAGLAITTAKYYTPSGVCIQDTGIFPDIKIEPEKLTEKEAEDFIKFFKNDYALKFVRKHKDGYTDKEWKAFLEQLKDDEINLDENLIKAQIKEQEARTKGQHYFADINNDNVLRQASQFFSAFEIFNKK